MPDLGHSEIQRRRTAVATFNAARRVALADPRCSPLRRARLTAFGGAGISAQALAVLSGVSRETIRKAEQNTASVSRSSLRRLASALDIPLSEIL